MIPIALVLLALFLPASARAAPTLRVSVPEGLRCPSSDELLDSLRRRFGLDSVAAGQPRGDELGLSLAQLPDALELSLVSKPGENPYVRRLPAGQGNCADLAETIGLVVDAWLRDLPWHGAGFLRDVPEVARPGPKETVAQPSPPAAAVSATIPKASAAHARDRLTLRIGGGGNLGDDATAFGPEATLSADASIAGRFGAAVFVSVLENASARDQLSSESTASLSVSRQVLAIAARYSLSGDGGNGLRLFAGLALQAFESRSSGYTFDPSSFEVAPAGFAAALWQQRIAGRLSAYAQLSALVGPAVEFDASQAGGPRAVLTLPPARFDASLGLAVTLF